jgi:hypothetical protein
MPRRCRRRNELGIAADLSNERSGVIVSYNVEENYKMIKQILHVLIGVLEPRLFHRRVRILLLKHNSY